MSVAQPAGAQPINENDQADNMTGQLLLARSLQREGQYKVARDVLLQALCKAPNSHLLLNQLGSVQQDLGRYMEAERSYLRALDAAAQTGDDPERITILNNLGTLYLDTNQYSKAERIPGDLEQLRPDVLDAHPAQAAGFLNVIASLEHARNRDDEAERYYSRALHLLHQAEGPSSLDRAMIEANLGFVRLEAGHFDSAGDFFRQAIGEIETASGRDDPALVRPLLNLARCENMSGHPDHAEPLARRAVELSVNVFGEAHPVTASAMLEEATALRRLGRKKPAHDLERRAKVVLRNNSTANPAIYTVSLRDLASAEKQ